MIIDPIDLLLLQYLGIGNYWALLTILSDMVGIFAEEAWGYE